MYLQLGPGVNKECLKSNRCGVRAISGARDISRRVVVIKLQLVGFESVVKGG